MTSPFSTGLQMLLTETSKEKKPIMFKYKPTQVTLLYASLNDVNIYTNHNKHLPQKKSREG